MPKHRLPLGTKVSFANDPYVYQAADYQEIIACPPDCDLDHDCFPEPHLCVSRTITSLMPLSQLRHVFDEAGRGREATALDKGGEE